MTKFTNGIAQSEWPEPPRKQWRINLTKKEEPTPDGDFIAASNQGVIFNSVRVEASVSKLQGARLSEYVTLCKFECGDLSIFIADENGSTYERYVLEPGAPDLLRELLGGAE